MNIQLINPNNNKYNAPNFRGVKQQKAFVELVESSFLVDSGKSGPLAQSFKSKVDGVFQSASELFRDVNPLSFENSKNKFNFHTWLNNPISVSKKSNEIKYADEIVKDGINITDIVKYKELPDGKIVKYHTTISHKPGEVGGASPFTQVESFDYVLDPATNKFVKA